MVMPDHTVATQNKTSSPSLEQPHPMVKCWLHSSLSNSVRAHCLYDGLYFSQQNITLEMLSRYKRYSDGDTATESV